ncbi:MAG: efflux transporter outer membrane subunit [Betaproteobacteria bacterium]|nr:efflux transporter outer membrane subunit [Betaproteobacteria bacterium]
MMRPTLTLTLLTLALAGCAIGPDYQRPALPTDTRFHAPLPQAHDGQVASLSNWWAAWNDAALTTLIDQAQAHNPSVAQAAARIREARATVNGQTAVLFPAFTARGADTRSKGGMQGNPFAAPGELQHQRSGSIDAIWEFDVVGGARRAREASTSRLSARTADWHDARVSMAAEVAMQYVNLRTCEVLLTGYDVDVASRAKTADLTQKKARAGLEAPANAALAEASVAEARARRVAQATECDLTVKALVALTGLPEDALRTTLRPGTARLPGPRSFAVAAVPAGLLEQRPDLVSAEAETIAAGAEIGVALADRFPRLTLTGTIGTTEFLGASAASAGAFAGRSWSYGPALSLPLFDFGRRAAQVDVQRARFEGAVAAYRGKVAAAVREVEEALARLHGAQARTADADKALSGYRSFLNANEARVHAGAGNLPELEEARRSVVAAQGVAVGVARERLAAWIALYKAVGGGFTTTSPDTPSPSLRTADAS